MSRTRARPRQIYSEPSENDSDIQESTSDLEAARGAREASVAAPAADADADADYVPTLLTDTSSEEEDNLRAAPAGFDPDGFVLRGRTLKWPDGARARLSDVGEVYTEVRIGEHTFVVKSTPRMKGLFQRVGRDPSEHMLKPDKDIQIKSSDQVLKRTRKKRRHGHIAAAVRYLRSSGIATVTQLNAVFSAALLSLLQQYYGDISMGEFRTRMVTLPDADAYISTWDGVRVSAPDGSATIIEAHDLSGVEQIAELVDAPAPVIVQVPRSDPGMTEKAFRDTVVRVADALRVLEEHPDWTVIDDAGSEWLVHSLAAQLFLEDQASIMGWTVRRLWPSRSAPACPLTTPMERLSF